MLRAATSLSELLEPEIRQRIEAQLDGLERDVAALPERPMRRALLEARIASMSDSELVGALTLLVGRVAEGRQGARVLMIELALDESVIDTMSYDRKSAAYAMARAIGAEGVARMFLSPRPRENLTADEAVPDNEHLTLPLGVRRTAARTSDRLLLDRLLHDRNPRVIAMLLDNPRVIERDVVRIAAMRPTQPEVLSELARHPRWSSNYRVRKALACNPYTPRPIAMRLLPGLLVQDLRLALETASMDPLVEAEMRRLLGLRARRAPNAEPAEHDDAEIEALIATLTPPDAHTEETLRREDVDSARQHEEEAVRNPFEDEDAEDLRDEIEALIAQGRGGFAIRPVEDEDPFDQS